MSLRYPLFFEKMIRRSVANMKALLPLEGDVYRGGLAYLESICGAGKQAAECNFISSANALCRKNSINAVFCNRVSILVFPKHKPGMVFPHNHGSTKELEHGIDSS
jgi:hypothetical protein